jgi:hypothetical protein
MKEKEPDPYDAPLNAPSLLRMFSNLIELLRLRQELILCMSECVTLEEVYHN